VIISILNQKGGVGKTTLSISLAAALAWRKLRVLLVDADPQGSALDWVAVRGEKETPFAAVGIPKMPCSSQCCRRNSTYGPPRKP
jgi:chromosome partitioning protein